MLHCSTIWEILRNREHVENDIVPHEPEHRHYWEQVAGMNCGYLIRPESMLSSLETLTEAEAGAVVIVIVAAVAAALVVDEAEADDGRRD